MVRKKAGEVDESLGEFVREFSPQLFRTAYLLVGDRHEAEDLLQQALLRTSRRWPAARSAPRAYVHRVLVNLARDHHRARSRRPRHVFLEDDIASTLTGCDLAEGVASRDAVVGALQALPDRQREVVVLRFFLDLSVGETARAMRASEGTVKSYTSRAMATLKERLEPRVAVDSARRKAPK